MPFLKKKWNETVYGGEELRQILWEAYCFKRWELCSEQIAQRCHSLKCYNMGSSEHTAYIRPVGDGCNIGFNGMMTHRACISFPRETLEVDY